MSQFGGLSWLDFTIWFRSIAPLDVVTFSYFRHTVCFKLYETLKLNHEYNVMIHYFQFLCIYCKERIYLSNESIRKLLGSKKLDMRNMFNTEHWISHHWNRRKDYSLDPLKSLNFWNEKFFHLLQGKNFKVFSFIIMSLNPT